MAQRPFVQVIPVGSVAAGGMLWRDSRGALQLTLIVKAELEWTLGGPMRLLGPPQLATRDEHFDGDPTRSLRQASDYVPYRPRADVWMTGHAYAPTKRPVRVGIVRLGVFQGSRAVVDKVMHVYGDRPHADAQPEPFVIMPLVYERAYGGIGFDDNPVGVGADERPLFPNVLHPSQPERPACFAPVSRYWKARRSHLPDGSRKAMEGAVPEIPADLGWDYYQASPADQRSEYLAGDEWLVLDGVHPEHVRVQTRLPKMRGQARILDDDSHEGTAVALVLDTLAIDADARRCEVTWRGMLSVDSAQRTSQQAYAAGVEVDGLPIDWAEAHARRFDARPTDQEQEQGAAGRLDETAVTIAHTVAAETERDPVDLDATTIDPPRGPTRHASPNRPRASPPTLRSHVRPRYPRSQPDGEDTQTAAMPIPMAHGVDLDHTQPDLITNFVDTTPGAPAPVDTLSMGQRSPCDTLDDAEPSSPASSGRPPRRVAPSPPSRSGVKSLPPPRLDIARHAASLRDAGASEADIAATIEAIEADEDTEE